MIPRRRLAPHDRVGGAGSCATWILRDHACMHGDERVTCMQVLSTLVRRRKEKKKNMQYVGVLKNKTKSSLYVRHARTRVHLVLCYECEKAL
jgi:hypothetical protein